MTHSGLLDALVGAFIGMTVITCILWVLFGQLTVRKLRKNLVTRDALGLEFASGYDILNVAEALTLPRRLMRLFRDGKLGWLYADPDVVYEHTSRFDRVLARVFFGCFVFTGTGLLVLVLLYFVGILD